MRLTSRATAGFLAAVLVAAAAACNGRGTPPTASEPEDGTDASTTVELLEHPAPVAPFTLTDIEGRTLSSSDWKGKVVLLNFWATWCPPCLAEIPDLIALQDKYRDRLVVIGISEDELPTDKVKQFTNDRKVNYPIVMETEEIRQLFTGIIALPTTFVLDHDGRISYKHVGLLNAQVTEGVTRALAGMPLNAKVERVEDPDRLSSQGVAQIKEIPGVDLTVVPDEQRATVIQALNSEKCTCGCGLSVAKCRIDDPQCDVSLPIAKTIVAKYVPAR